jgi:DNA-binding response OmpR family regulator
VTCVTCPHCGHDLERVENFRLGDLEIVRGAEIRWKGRRVPLSLSRLLIVTAIARADGALVSIPALAEAIGYDGDDPAKILDVHICRIRQAFREIDPDFDCVERERGCTGSGLTRWRNPMRLVPVP